MREPSPYQALPLSPIQQLAVCQSRHTHCPCIVLCRVCHRCYTSRTRSVISTPTQKSRSSLDIADRWPAAH